jgi:hypothetical protein
VTATARSAKRAVWSTPWRLTRRTRPALEAREHKRVWFSIHALLSAAGNASKLLWPSRDCGTTPQRWKLIEKRRRALCALLSVKNSSPLRSRTFRNHFEHFDSRLDSWIEDTGGQIYVDLNIGPRGNLIHGFPPERFLRHFDPEPYVLTFQDRGLPLRPLIDEIRDVHTRAANQRAVYGPTPSETQLKGG